MLDLIIIGAGPAGITAAIYAARKNVQFMVITRDIGGQTAWSGDIENYTGYQFVTGPELTAKFEEHMRSFAFDLRNNETVLEIKKSGGIITVRTDKGAYEARTVIIASGKKSKELNVPGEKEFKNRGLTYCATCDAPLFKGKDVAVIGGGNSGLDAAIQLLKIARHIYIVNIAAELTGDAIMQEQLKNNPAVTILNSSRLASVFGDKFVGGIKVEQEGSEKTLAVQGVFIEVGLLPNADFAAGIKKNRFNEIEVNSANGTDVPGIFAAGDVTNTPEKQIIVAAGEGCKAALNAFRYLVLHKFSASL